MFLYTHHTTSSIYILIILVLFLLILLFPTNRTTVFLCELFKALQTISMEYMTAAKYDLISEFEFFQTNSTCTFSPLLTHMFHLLPILIAQRRSRAREQAQSLSQIQFAFVVVQFVHVFQFFVLCLFYLLFYLLFTLLFINYIHFFIYIYSRQNQSI